MRTMLRVLRSTHGLTQTAVGRSVGTTQDQLSRIERGLLKPEPNLKLRLAALFGSSPHRILEPVDD